MKLIDIISFGTVTLSYKDRTVGYCELRGEGPSELNAVLSEVYNCQWSCQKESGRVRRATQQLAKLNPGQKFISLCPSDGQFQSSSLVFQHGPHDAQYR